MTPAISRRELLALVAGASALESAVAEEASPAANFTVVAEGLRFPESPLPMSDGSVLVVEIAAGDLARIAPDGGKTVVAHVGGGPNGAALGPDGAVYLCNNGGFEWKVSGGRWFPAGQARDYRSGSIQRVELDTGKVTTLHTHVGRYPLSAPNDLVFDAAGGFWFTDYGQNRERNEDHGGLYYVTPDHQRVMEVVYPLFFPNGLGLSPDGHTVYVSSTLARMVTAWDIIGPGQVAPTEGPLSGRLVASLPDLDFLDSLAIDVEGNLHLATVVRGGILSLSPSGAILRRLALPDALTTSIRFGGAQRRTAFITLGTTGRLISMPWPTAGLAPAFPRSV